jgi:glycosyltransferase involved in cell wall biosynthesis
MRKKKVLIVTSTFPRWIDDVDPPFVFELAKRLVSQFDVIVIAPYFPGSKNREVIEGIEIHRFRYFFPPLNKLAGSTGILPTLKYRKLYFFVIPFFLLAQFFSLLHLAYKIRPETIHAHWLFPQGTLAIAIGKIYKIPTILTVHGADIFALQGFLFQLVKKYTLRRANYITTVSNSLAISCFKFLPHRNNLKVIPMGVDSTLFSKENRRLRSQKNAAHKLLFVGRLSEKKGVKYLLESMPQILNQFPETTLTIIGTGELEIELKEQAKNLDLLDHVSFIGSVPNQNLPIYYKNADIFIGPSVYASDGDSEGLGLTFIEASLCGCLLIGTNVGGICDIIEDNLTGFLVSPGNSKELAEKLLYVLNHISEFDELRARSRQHCITTFDWSVISEKFAHLIHQSCSLKSTK